MNFHTWEINFTIFFSKYSKLNFEKRGKSKCSKQVGKRKGVVAPLTQTHKGLPIWSWVRAPGTPYNQIVGYLSEDPTRRYNALAEMRKWGEFLEGLQDSPVDLVVLLNEDGRQQVTCTVWWSLSEMSPSHCISRYQDPTDLRKDLQM